MDAKVVAQRISAARKAVGLTQEGLAAKANISATHVGVIERGKNTAVFSLADGVTLRKCK